LAGTVVTTGFTLDEKTMDRIDAMARKWGNVSRSEAHRRIVAEHAAKAR